MTVDGKLKVRVANGPKAATTNSNTPTVVTPKGQTFSITLDGAYDWGLFDDAGAVFVVINQATPNITSRSPVASTLEGKAVNGAMLNHLVGTNQAYDERASAEMFTGYATPTSLPQAVKSGDVFTICKSFEGTIAGNERTGVPDEFCSFFFVSEVPLDGAMAPAGLQWAGRPYLKYYYIDYDAKIAALPEYDTSGFLNLRDFNTIYSKLNRFAPILAGDDDTRNPLHYRAMLPRQLSIEELGNSGKFLCDTINDSCLMLISSSYTTEQKKQIATALCSFGIQCGEPYFENDLGIEGNGQHAQFQFTPWALAMHWMGRDADIESNFKYSGNFTQAFQFTQELIDQCVPGHTNMAWPYTYRQRNLNAISGNEITVEVDGGSGFEGDNGKTRVTSMYLTDGTNTTLITGQNSEDWVSAETVLTVDDATGFSVNTGVWFLPQVEPVVGDYDWVGAGLPSFPQFNPNPDQAYRRENFWSGQVLLLKALGVNAPSLTPVYGYVQRCNSGNQPSASWSFTSHHTTAFEEEFWNAHAATIFA